jgi:DNA-binding SARP family transcriptional activator
MDHTARQSTNGEEGGDIGSASLLRVSLLGGFRVDRDDLAAPISHWQRRSAKTLTKLLATVPGHALHREQVLELLWPGSSLESALNSFGKTLHAARRAFQPALPPRQPSPYLVMVDSMVALDPEHVEVDADRFERLAHDALGRHEISPLESALAAYRGELLPEDRYADWCARRRDFLADLRVRLLVEMADLLEARGAYNDSADRLRAVLEHDPTREEVHRRLMRLYAEMGTPDQAVRQFHACEEVLQRELDFAPQEETVAVYHDVLAHRTSQRKAPSRQPRERSVPSRGDADQVNSDDPFVGRTGIVEELCRQLSHPVGPGGMVIVTGEAGIGKTRLLEELAKGAVDQGAILLWGGAGAHGGHFDCGPFAVALEGYIAALPLAKRRELARRYQPLTSFVPSLVGETSPAHAAGGNGDHLDVVPAIVGLLADLARHQPVLLVLGDLCDTDAHSLDIIGYLAHLATRRPWLLVGAAREDEVQPGTPVARLIANTTREGLCRNVELQPLARAECDELVAVMLPDAPQNPQLLDQIYTASRGNPMFIRELVQQIGTDGELDADAGMQPAPLSVARVPSRVRNLAEARLATLDSTVQRVVVLAAAAATTEISLADLRGGASALDPPLANGALLDALDRALETGFLEERDGGYGFRHPLVQSAIYDRLSRHRRAELGRALGHAKSA